MAHRTLFTLPYGETDIAAVKLSGQSEIFIFGAIGGAIDGVKDAVGGGLGGLFDGNPLEMFGALQNLNPANLLSSILPGELSEIASAATGLFTGNPAPLMGLGMDWLGGQGGFSGLGLPI